MSYADERQGRRLIFTLGTLGGALIVEAVLRGYIIGSVTSSYRLGAAIRGACWAGVILAAGVGLVAGWRLRAERRTALHLFFVASLAVFLMGLVKILGDARIALPFAKEEWTGAADRGLNIDNPRRHMVRDLVWKYKLPGMHRDSVETLLGPPTLEDWSQGLPFPGYAIGAWTGAEHSGVLAIEYGGDGVALTIHLLEE